MSDLKLIHYKHITDMLKDGSLSKQIEHNQICGRKMVHTMLTYNAKTHKCPGQTNIHL